eukprot:7830740-Pyramimonas_sp.AAC.1
MRDEMYVILRNPLEWHLEGYTDYSQPWRLFGLRKDSGGELTNSPVVEQMNKGLTTVLIPSAH